MLLPDSLQVNNQSYKPGPSELILQHPQIQGGLRQSKEIVNVIGYLPSETGFWASPKSHKKWVAQPPCTPCPGPKSSVA